MPTIAAAQLPPPGSWEEFESMCADLYARIWQDDSTQKHGRTGQPQAGVDIYGRIYGRPDKTSYAGVQCKNKGNWPPQDLTIREIEEEVEKAENFVPKLTALTIATTARNDIKVQEFARTLTAAREQSGLFSVSVVSWNEISRRLSSHPDLLRKYYPEFASVDIVRELSANLPRLLADELRTAGLVPSPQVSNPRSISDPTIVRALERDLADRYNRALRRSFFLEAAKVDEFSILGDVALEEQYAVTSPDLRRTILLRASRSAAVKNVILKAELFLQQAQIVAGAESDLIAQARILEARGEQNKAIALL